MAPALGRPARSCTFDLSRMKAAVRVGPVLAGSAGIRRQLIAVMTTIGGWRGYGRGSGTW
jgi:hypothetical protein